MKKLFVFTIAVTFVFLLQACKKDAPTLDFEEKNLSVIVGDTFKLEPLITNLEGRNLVEYEIDDETVVSLSGDKFTALKEGSTTIVAKLKDHPEISVTLNVTVGSYSITYNLDGGKNPDGTLVKFTPDDLPIELPAPTKAGNTFLGWYSTSDFSGEEVRRIGATTKENVTLYAKWQEIDYVIQYNLNGGSNPTTAPTGYVVSDTPLTLPTPTRSGYVFVGWYDNATFNGDYVTEIPQNSMDNKTFYARWNQIFTYTLGYQLNGGVNAPTNITSYNILDLPITLAEPTREGYIFKGWYTEQHFRTEPVSEIDFAKNYTLYAKWESEEEPELVDVYVNPALADEEDGETVTYKAMSFVVGESAFATLSEGLAVATNKLYVVGTHTENVTISKSDLTILGPNAFVDPNSETRSEESVIKGTLTVASGVHNLTINGLSFTDTGKVTGAGDIKNLEFSYNRVHNTTAASTPWQEGPGYSSGFFTFSSANNGEMANFIIKNNAFDQVSDVNLNFSRITHLTVEDNIFKNFDRDAIRFDTGGFNQGNLTFVGNEFVRDTLGGNNGIYFRIYGGDQATPTKIIIENNLFKNIGQTNLESYSGAISMRNYQEKDTWIVIQYNTFETCANYIHIRNNATAANHASFTWDATVNYNVFKGIPTTYYHKNWTGSDKETTNPPKLNFDFNYFEDNSGNPITDLSAHSSKFMNLASYANNYQTKTEYDAMLEEVEITEVEVLNPVDALRVSDKYQIDILIKPRLASGQELIFSSSDEDVVTVSNTGLLTAKGVGEAIITVSSKADETVKTTFTVNVTAGAQLKVSYEGNAALNVGDILTIDVEFPGENTFEFSSSDTSIATVSAEGVVTAVAPGTVLITIKVAGSSIETQVGFTVYEKEEVSDILQFLIDNNRGVVERHDLYYIGSDDGSMDYLNTIYTPVSNYFFDRINIIKNMLPSDRPNYSGIEMSSIEFITIHDTANSRSGSTAASNSNWVLNLGNTSTSWHYTVGNDGVYQQLPDNIVGYHAGDGSRTFGLVDTGVKANGEKPVLAINERGFFTLNGVESKLQAPMVAQITEGGIYTTIGENGNYFMNNHYWSSGYRVIANGGGNRNSIGIETAVDHGSDVFFTWLRTAKLVARLLVEYDLGPDRVMLHNHFSGKPCPRTMMTARLEHKFFDLVEAEYEILKNYGTYTIEFESHNPEILSNTGRIIEAPLYTTNVSYTVTVTNGDSVESITLNALVPGTLE